MKKAAKESCFLKIFVGLAPLITLIALNPVDPSIIAGGYEYAHGSISPAMFRNEKQNLATWNTPISSQKRMF
jgi:hypothetical protein